MFLQISRTFAVSPIANQQWGSKKKNRHIKLRLQLDTMADPKTESILAPLRANVKEQVTK